MLQVSEVTKQLLTDHFYPPLAQIISDYQYETFEVNIRLSEQFGKNAFVVIKIKDKIQKDLKFSAFTSDNGFKILANSLSVACKQMTPKFTCEEPKMGGLPEVLLYWCDFKLLIFHDDETIVVDHLCETINKWQLH